MTEHEGRVDACDGAMLHYRVAGSGPTVVLCDGILCEGYIWKYLWPTLLAKHRVVHWQYRGHGKSERPRDLARVEMRDFAVDLWKVLDAVGADKTTIIGHSMGVQVALEGYRAHRERVSAMVFLCGSYGRVTRTFHGTDALALALPKLRMFVDRYPDVVRAMMSRTPSWLALQAAKWLREIDPVRTRAEDMVPYFEHLSKMDPTVYVAMLEAAGRHSAEDLLHEIHVPTLVVAAERDTFTPPRLARQMATTIENATLMMVSEGSHSVPIEQPERVNPTITSFLDAAGA